MRGWPQSVRSNESWDELLLQLARHLLRLPLKHTGHYVEQAGTNGRHDHLI